MDSVGFLVERVGNQIENGKRDGFGWVIGQVGVELENGQRDEFSWVGGELDQEQTKRGIWLGSLVGCVDFLIEKGHKDGFGLLVGWGIRQRLNKEMDLVGWVGNEIKNRQKDGFGWVGGE